MPARARKPGDEVGQFDEVGDAQERTSITHHDLRIRGDHVGPLRRHGANGQLIDLQQESFAVAVVALAHARELLPAERVERVRYTHKACTSGGNVCISN